MRDARVVRLAAVWAKITGTTKVSRTNALNHGHVTIPAQSAGIVTWPVALYGNKK